MDYKAQPSKRPKDFRFIIQLLLIILALFTMFLGMILGFTSHTVHYYQAVPTQQPFDITAIPSANNRVDIYIQPTANHQTYYVVHDKDFTTPFTANILNDSHAILSLICKQDKNDLFTVDITLANNNTLNGVGCPVVEISLQQPDQKVLEFMTAEYAAHHDDYYQNNWPQGVGVISASLLFILAVWIIPTLWRRKPQ